MLQLAASIALNHHEKVRWLGLSASAEGKAIPLEGRIVAVADVFDALTSARPTNAWPLEQAASYLREGRGSHFDPDCVDALLGAWDECCRSGTVSATKNDHEDFAAGIVHRGSLGFRLAGLFSLIFPAAGRLRLLHRADAVTPDQPAPRSARHGACQDARRGARDTRRHGIVGQARIALLALSGTPACIKWRCDRPPASPSRGWPRRPEAGGTRSSARRATPLVPPRQGMLTQICCSRRRT